MQNYIQAFVDMMGGSIATAITLSITVITSIGLLVSNLARYFHAKRYGIPLKMVNPATIPDSLDIWVLFVAAFVLGIFLPDIMMNSTAHTLVVFVVVFVSFISSFTFLAAKRVASKMEFELSKKHKVKFEVAITPSHKFLIIGSVALAGTYAFIHLVNNYLAREGLVRFLFGVATFVRVVFIIFVCLLFIINIFVRLFGEKDVVTVDIEGETHLVTLKHNSRQWILMPCTIEEDVCVNGVPVHDKVSFTKGKFIIRDLSAIAHTSPVVHRKGLRLETNIEL